MTLPIERARALRLAGELPRWMQVSEAAPLARRANAARILRYCLDGVELRLWAHRVFHFSPLIWLAPEAPVKLIGNTTVRTEKERS